MFSFLNSPVAQSAYVTLNLFDWLISWWLLYRRGSVIVQSEFDCSVNNSFRNASFWKAVFSASQIWNVLGEISSWLIQPGLLGNVIRTRPRNIKLTLKFNNSIQLTGSRRVRNMDSNTLKIIIFEPDWLEIHWPMDGPQWIGKL